MRPDGSIVIATGNDDALGVYRCTPYNSYGTAGESQPTRVLLKVRLGGWAHCPSPSPKLLPPCCAKQPVHAACPSACPAVDLHPAPPAAKPCTVCACLPGPPHLHGAPQGGILPGGGPGAGDPLRRPRGSPPNCHLAEGRSCHWGTSRALLGGGCCFWPLGHRSRAVPMSMSPQMLHGHISPGSCGTRGSGHFGSVAL